MLGFSSPSGLPIWPCRYGRNSASYERRPSQKAHLVGGARGVRVRVRVARVVVACGGRRGAAGPGAEREGACGVMRGATARASVPVHGGGGAVGEGRGAHWVSVSMFILTVPASIA